MTVQIVPPNSPRAGCAFVFYLTRIGQPAWAAHLALTTMCSPIQ